MRRRALADRQRAHAIICSRDAERGSIRDAQFAGSVAVRVQYLVAHRAAADHRRVVVVHLEGHRAGARVAVAVRHRIIHRERAAVARARVRRRALVERQRAHAIIRSRDAECGSIRDAQLAGTVAVRVQHLVAHRAAADHRRLVVDDRHRLLTGIRVAAGVRHRPGDRRIAFGISRGSIVRQAAESADSPVGHSPVQGKTMQGAVRTKRSSRGGKAIVVAPGLTLIEAPIGDQITLVTNEFAIHIGQYLALCPGGVPDPGVIDCAFPVGGKAVA